MSVSWVGNPKTWAGGAVTSSEFNAEVRDRFDWLKAAALLHGIDSGTVQAWLASARRGCSLYGSSVSVPSGTPTAMAYTGEAWDAGGYHDTVTNNDRVTIPTGQGGWYSVAVWFQFAGGTSDQVRKIDIRKNAGGLPILPNGEELVAEPYYEATIVRGTMYGECELVAGDYLRTIFDHSGGAGVTARSVLTVRRIY